MEARAELFVASKASSCNFLRHIFDSEAVGDVVAFTVAVVRADVDVTPTLNR